MAVTFCDAQDFMLIPDNLIVLEREFAGTVGIQDMRMGHIVESTRIEPFSPRIM